MANTLNTFSRREIIRRLIREQAIATQEELGRLLAREGHAVTQATLSRDLAQLGALRIPGPEGGTCYALPESRGLPTADRLREMGQMVMTVQENGSLVVVHTQPGAAPAVARAIDLLRVPEGLGTIAGDDTIFVAPSKGKSTRSLTRKLLGLFGKQEA
jgi:transcriptional regulator of arginine metabolism